MELDLAGGTFFFVLSLEGLLGVCELFMDEASLADSV
jgi:hypothetical protein